MTRSSVARRQRRLAGRPSGTFRSLLKDPQRHSVAAWLLFEPMFGPHAAARLAIAAIDEDSPIEFSTLDGVLMAASFTYKPPRGAPAADFNEQARSLATKARLVASRATETELTWLAASSGRPGSLIGFTAAGNWVGLEQSQKLLKQAGWGDVLKRIARRLDIPADVKSLTPFDRDRLRAGGQRLLAATRARLKAMPAQDVVQAINSPMKIFEQGPKT